MSAKKEYIWIAAVFILLIIGVILYNKTNQSVAIQPTIDPNSYNIDFAELIFMDGKLEIRKDEQVCSALSKRFP